MYLRRALHPRKFLYMHRLDRAIKGGECSDCLVTAATRFIQASKLHTKNALDGTSVTEQYHMAAQKVGIEGKPRKAGSAKKIKPIKPAPAAATEDARRTAHMVAYG